MSMRRVGVVMMVVPSMIWSCSGPAEEPGEGAPTFKADVMPIFKKHCLAVSCGGEFQSECIGRWMITMC